MATSISFSVLFMKGALTQQVMRHRRVRTDGNF
jgi:hypothetical protein